MAERDAPTLGYRPGLDGIRALAVAGVFLYHARVSWMPGGFLGVDVFFALSGYLITSLLLVEWERAGRIDLRRFWGRRARRLLPAVIVVIALAVVAAATIARDDLARTRGDAISSLLYFTNWHLIAASHSYFNSFGRPSLLQHLWSLAVEEQFYVVWPLLLVAGLALLGRRRLLPLVLAAIGGSTALAWLLYDPERDPSRVYYGTDTRAATLLVGALLAFLWHERRGSGGIRLSRRGVALLDLAGLAALAATLGFFWRVQDYDPRLYRGGLLVVAVCATVLVGVVAHPETRLGRLLGREPLRWLGVRSYGIYLWHWPVVVLSRPGIDVPWRGPGVIVAQAAAVVALAGLSYRFVEQPIRSGAAQRRIRAWLLARPQPQRLAAAVAVPGVLATGIAVLFAISPPPARVEVAAAQPPPIPESSFALAEQPPSSAASSGPQTAHGTRRPARTRGPVLAIGDSVMLGCSPALERRLGRRLRVDAVVARQTIDVVDRLAAYRSRGALPDTVVVQVGDNGPAWYADLVRLRRTLAPVRTVVLVNVRVDRSWQGQVDHQLAQFVASWPRARIANWYGSSSDGVLADGVHPTPAGCDTYAGVIARTLAGETRSRG